MDPLCRVHLNWENFRSNLRLLRYISSDLMPVIKADAYGHGARRAAIELEKEGVGWAAAGTLEEAAAVRDAGFSGRIVILLSFLRDADDVELCLRSRLLPLVHRWEDLRVIHEAMDGRGGTLGIAFKVETGMNRLGFPLEEVDRAARFMADSGRIRPEVLISHLSVADDPREDAFTRLQCSVFWKSAAILRRYFPGMTCSLNNTAGLLRRESSRKEICRPGLALYGCNPLYGTSEEERGRGLLPVMSVTAPLISTHVLRRGESLGYGRTYIADSDRLIGWAAIGYADGYRRCEAPGRSMCLRGCRVPVIGRVAMQMTCLDLSSLPFSPSAGEDVHVLGGPGNAVTAQEMAHWWGTIPYEVTCALGRNPLAQDDPPATR